MIKKLKRSWSTQAEKKQRSNCYDQAITAVQAAQKQLDEGKPNSASRTCNLPQVPLTSAKQE